MRVLTIALLAALALAAVSPLARAGSAEACAGLIGSNGAVNLGRTTTLAGYHDGVEHYVTAFEFQGGGGEFGTLIPLPGVPTKVERGGDWTLQRLQRETLLLEGDGFRLAQEAPAATGAVVLQEVRIDALDITILKGGSADVAAWAKDHGFRLSPDAPEVLHFYAQRSPIFLAAVFDGEAAARSQQIGDGTPVHVTIPTDNPWVPLRILGLGKQPADLVQADVFLLTDEKPALLPAPGDGMFLTHSDRATDLLLNDLRTDKGGEWVPGSAWLTKLSIDTPAGNLSYDLAVDTSGAGQPSRVDAGLDLPVLGAVRSLEALPTEDSSTDVTWAVAAAAVFVALLVLAARLRAAGAAGWTGRR